MRASDRAYAALRSEIVGWRIEPGTSLAEVELAERLGVSRTPVREALARLMADGLVAPVGGRGLVVSPFSLAEVELLYELRIALETQASRGAPARCCAPGRRGLRAARRRVRAHRRHARR